MVKIIINENQINKIKKIIREALLKEALSKKVYHFTTLSSVMDIINDDRFVLSSSLIGDSDDFKKNKKFFISLTRQRNGSIGYSKPYNVRICFDGDKLNERFSGKPIDYWSNDMGKQTYYRALNRNEKIPYNQTNTESEDRLFFNEPVIENIMQYIERIDILINKENENNLKIAKNISLSAYRSKIFFYDNKKDFNFQTVNTINDFIENNIPYQEFKLKRQVFENVGYNLSQLMTFIINCENIYNNKEADIFVGKLLKK